MKREVMDPRKMGRVVETLPEMRNLHLRTEEKIHGMADDELQEILLRRDHLLRCFP